MANQTIGPILWVLASTMLVGCTSIPKVTPFDGGMTTSTPAPNTVRTLTPTLSLFPTATQAPGFTFTLNFDRSVYYSGDEIIAEVVLKNISTEPVLVNSRLPPFGQWLYFYRILNPNGEVASYIGGFQNEISPSEDDFFILSPGQSISMKNDLTWSYDISLTGTYLVWTSYSNSFQPSQFDPSDKRVAWMGELKSNVATFTLEP